MVLLCDLSIMCDFHFVCSLVRNGVIVHILVL